MLRTELGELLREERHNRGLSLRELAGMADISATYLGEVERGLKEPSFEIMEALARALDLSLAEVLHRVADRLEPPLPARSLGFAAGAGRPPARTASMQTITNQLSQEDIYALARFGEFLLQAQGSSGAESGAESGPSSKLT